MTRKEFMTKLWFELRGMFSATFPRDLSVARRENRKRKYMARKEAAARKPPSWPQVSVTPLQTCCLYRHYDATGALLYVGITSNAPGRFREHYASQPWRTEVATSRYEHYDTRDDALLAEAWAITTEHPLHNKHRPVPHGPRPKARSER